MRSLTTKPSSGFCDVLDRSEIEVFPPRGVDMDIRKRTGVNCTLERTASALESLALALPACPLPPPTPN